MNALDDSFAWFFTPECDASSLRSGRLGVGFYREIMRQTSTHPVISEKITSGVEGVSVPLMPVPVVLMR